PRRHAALNKPRDAVDQRARLTRAGTGDHQQRTVAVGDRGELRRVEQLGVLDPEGALVRLGARAAQKDNLVGHGATILSWRGVDFSRRAILSGGAGARSGQEVRLWPSS